MRNIILLACLIDIFWIPNVYGAVDKALANNSVVEKKSMSTRAQIVESGKCAAHFSRLERAYSIPKDLLHSISLQESGKHLKNLDKKIPWPWTVNVEGKGFYFNSKNEAIGFVQQEKKKGKKSIDVGCMQISLLYHGNEFDSLEDAFDPKRNVEYGAIFLREKYEQYKSWKKAVANYHSADYAKGSKYQASVLKIAGNIEKHKFETPKYQTFMVPGRRLYSASMRSLTSQSKYHAMKSRNRSNMMYYQKRES